MVAIVADSAIVDSHVLHSCWLVFIVCIAVIILMFVGITVVEVPVDIVVIRAVVDIVVMEVDTIVVVVTPFENC